MAETQKGVAVTWALGDFLAAGTGYLGANTVGNAQSAELTKDSDSAEITDFKGDAVAKIFFNGKKRLKFDVIPTADTLAHAKAQNIIPAPGTTITITDTFDTEAAGTYNLISATKSRSNKDAMKISMDLEKSTANDITAAVT